MTDKELLEYAAKAAELGGGWDIVRGKNAPSCYRIANGHSWNPLTNDGDAFRLLVKLQLFEEANMDIYYDRVGNDLYASTRRAIVLAASEIGKEMK